MALTLTEDETMLADSARGFFGRAAPVSAFRRLRDSGELVRFDPALWAQMAQMGFPGALIPEQHGGSGQGVFAAGLIAEQAGRVLAASPLLSCAVAADILAREADATQQGLLERIADGSLVIAFALDEGPRHDPERLQTRVTRSGESFVLDGAKRAVVDGGIADKLIVAAAGDTGAVLLLVDAAAQGVAVRPLDLLDSRNAADVSFTGVRLGPEAVVGAPGAAAAAISHALDTGRALLAAELLGMAQEAFDRTVAYLKEREQFGVKIGSFQALQHRAARLFMALELARAVVLKALRAADAGEPEASALASLAKGALTRTARQVLDEAVQLHGGVGVTDDFDIGLFLKRVRVAGDLYGDDSFQKDRLARLVWKI